MDMVKTPNNLDNKAIYYGHHIGCELGGRLVFTDPKTLTVGNFGLVVRNTIQPILLTPLSAITDEDLLDAYFLSAAMALYDHTMDFAPHLEMAKHWIEKEGEEGLCRFRSVVDFLRYRGYAISWIDLSIKDLIGYGWLKLRES